MNTNVLLHSWFEEVWNQKNDDFVREHMGCPCHIVGLPEAACNPDGFIAFRNNLQAGIKDMHIKVLESMEDEDRTIGTCCVTGTHAGSGNPVEFCFAYTATVENGKIVKAHNIIDFLTLLQQAETLPENALEQGLQP